ncbi:conserved hypothetical protein [Enterococcus faecium Com12]|nr:conserved hypothetical protein [Enterococcus faecium Com12]
MGIRFFTRNPDVFSCFIPKIWSSDSFFCPVCRFIDFSSNVDDFLPFVPTANLIRTSFFGSGFIQLKNILTVSIWLIITGALSLRALSRRN